MTLQPAGNVDQQSKTGGMGFREAILAKAFYLTKDGLGEFRS